MTARKEKIKVIELFAGVGGFRLGLEGFNGKSASSRFEEMFESNFEVVWSNQKEPDSSRQYASDVYRYRWPNANHSSVDIRTIVDEKGRGPVLDIVPEHTMLVAGFPCQDYSVANTLRNAEGIVGKKGVLWWSIYWLLRKCRDAGRPTKYLLLENVDRLLKSPRGQRGRDFAIMLASLADLGYAVEWRVVNAADYGMPQRRRRVFILGYHSTTEIYERINSLTVPLWIKDESVTNSAFPITNLENLPLTPEKLVGNLTKLTRDFGRNKSDHYRPFRNFGVMFEREYWTSEVEPLKPDFSSQHKACLRNYLHPEKVTDDFLVSDAEIWSLSNGWSYHKGPKSKSREDRETGHKYEWSEGGMELYDDLDKAARTIITSEGGSSPSRSKHLIIDPEGRTRRLLPIELDELSMFPPDHTKIGVNDDGKEYELPSTKRAFLIGNALVAGAVERLSVSLADSAANAHLACRMAAGRENWRSS